MMVGWSVGGVGCVGSLVCASGLGGCGGRMLVGWYEGLLADGFRRWRLRRVYWGWADGCLGGRRSAYILYLFLLPLLCFHFNLT